MNTTIDLNMLKTLWESTLGEAPAREQFAIWAALHSPDVIRQAILKAAMRNQTMNGGMTQDHRLRYASKVMQTLTAQAADHAANRERLRQEFEGQVQR